MKKDSGNKGGEVSRKKKKQQMENAKPEKTSFLEKTTGTRNAKSRKKKDTGPPSNNKAVGRDRHRKGIHEGEIWLNGE